MVFCTCQCHCGKYARRSSLGSNFGRMCPMFSRLVDVVCRGEEFSWSITCRMLMSHLRSSRVIGTGLSIFTGGPGILSSSLSERVLVHSSSNPLITWLLWAPTIGFPSVRICAADHIVSCWIHFFMCSWYWTDFLVWKPHSHSNCMLEA